MGYVDLENINMSYEILFSCCEHSEIYVLKLRFRSGVRHLDFCLLARLYSIPNEMLS